ncbi:aminotransferase class I/II-fold pyridoxal phosphate-dependent enzyme [Bradyrhizobium sp. INPA01-394B]|uniref:Aminotransferase class I/II-fold pyridoxal phosphate-dependent enzyme n=1 Tax=Bradyrhizobium campsiandrae TaxID=1729892 RepID=A0ABR7UC39_9BRAD|nr:GntG family PLP-dependent aldolase [Bradyrhizobium campsiandrae]MBC9875772.1 aminotransferase class I/II-fold pyridoxal phosphate-dependent enzyme [Bradyrhizobium campsiandrae]MBC9981665.1 aminotransferase class I/II-fold pyridoxal phosphate-dependent enzyme [Bradyrhizobium campsiandrae]
MTHQHETNAAGAGLSPVDLRSDTVTKPTEAMYARMASAPLGDDGLDGDPTVQELEAVAAAALGKDTGLFVPSCTMANLLATLAQSQRSEQVVLESSAHMYTSERGAATFTGLFYLAVAGTAGAMDLNLLEDALQGGGHKLKTGLVAMETSHNNASGAVLPLEHMQAVHTMASVRGVPVHLDGARLFNAATALDVAPHQIARHCDTVSLCLSKGLSAPAGAVLAGPRAVIERSRGFRRMLGGTQRQIGILAAAGLEAVQVMGGRLAEDHRRARALSEALNGMHPKLSATIPQTNIVQVDVSRSGRDSAAWSNALEKAGVKARPWGKQRLRCVTHRHIDDAAIDRAVAAFRAVAGVLI